MWNNNFLYLLLILFCMFLVRMLSKDKEKKIIFSLLILFVLLGMIDLKIAEIGKDSFVESLFVYIVPVMLSLYICLNLIKSEDLE